MVTPVLEKGATSRSVYIPKGAWKYHANNIIYEGISNIHIEVKAKYYLLS